jgi:hypothetical protein
MTEEQFDLKFLVNHSGDEDEEESGEFTQEIFTKLFATGQDLMDRYKQ